MGILLFVLEGFVKTKYIKTKIRHTCSFCSINGVCVLHLFSHVQLCVTPWIVARQALLSMGFSRQECWSGLPYFPPGDLPDPGMEPVSPMSPALTGRFFTTGATQGKQLKSNNGSDHKLQAPGHSDWGSGGELLMGAC